MDSKPALLIYEQFYYDLYALAGIDILHIKVISDVYGLTDEEALEAMTILRLIDNEVRQNASH